MKKHLRSLEFQKEVLALLLSAVLLATTYSVLGVNIFKVLLFGLASVVVLIPVFLFLSWVRRSGFVGGAVSVVAFLAFVYGFAMLNVAGYIESGVGFVEWLITRGDEIESARVYVITLLIGGAAFFGTVCYYFVVTRYRIAILTLISLVPCVVYAKAIADVNNGYLIVIATLNILIGVLEGRSKDFMVQQKKEKKKIFAKPEIKEQFTRKFRWSTVILSLSFIAIVMIIGAAIPKKTDAKYYDVFEDAFLGGDTTSDVSGIASDLMDISGNADGYRNVGNRRLYSIYGDKVNYLKRQHFDVYNFEKDYWTALPETSKIKYTQDEWAGRSEMMSLGRLKKALEIAIEFDPSLAEKYDLSWIQEQKDFSPVVNSMNVTSQNFSAAYLLVPEGTISVRPDDNAECEVAWGGTFYRTAGKAPEDYSYAVKYYDDNTSRIMWCLNGGAKLSAKEELSMLQDMTNAYKEKMESVGEIESYATLLDNAHAIVQANSYKELTKENTEKIPDRIKALAEEITAGYKYDFEKAIALSSYFSDNDYVYDLTYRAPDKSAEYFIFESKRGTCSDYATAYTLMARSVGLTVRYAEGYVAESSGRSRYYLVKESGAHAYPETFIPGVGWVIFEPTSGLIEEGSGFFGAIFSNINMDPRLLITIGIAVIVVAAVFTFIRFVIPFIIEASIVIRIILGTIDIKYVYKRTLNNVIYRRLRRKYRKIATIDKEITGYTPEEIRQLYAVYGKDVSEMVGLVDKISYSEAREINLKKLPASTRRKIAGEYVKAESIFTK